MSTHLFGTAVLTIDADESSAVITVPAVWDGSYERDYSAALLFLARSGMPYGTPHEVVDGPDADRYVFAWAGTPAAPWPAETVAKLDKDSRDPRTSDQREADAWARFHATYG